MKMSLLFCLFISLFFSAANMHAALATGGSGGKPQAQNSCHDLFDGTIKTLADPNFSVLFKLSAELIETSNLETRLNHDIIPKETIQQMLYDVTRLRAMRAATKDLERSFIGKQSRLQKKVSPKRRSKRRRRAFMHIKMNLSMKTKAAQVF